MNAAAGLLDAKVAVTDHAALIVTRHSPEPEQAPPPDPEPPAEAPDPEEDPEPEVPEPPKGVTKIDDDHWELRRRFVDRYAEDPSRLADARRKGKGWELRGIRKHSDAWWMGLRRADVVLRVNDLPLETDADLMYAYARLKDEDHFVVRLRRDGDLRDLTYDIVRKKK